MNSLDTLLPVNEQLNMLKGGGHLLFLLKCNNNIMQAANTAIPLRRSSQFKIKSFSKAVM